MKKIVLSAIAAVTLGTVAANATQLYTDSQGQVYTQPGEGRTAIESDYTPVTSKDLKFQFSGLIYFGYTYTQNDAYTNPYDSTDVAKSTVQGFQLRRNYVETKAFFKSNPKDYARVTFDTTQDGNNNDKLQGTQLEVVKYAYVYLDAVLPATGVEVGIVHRPWVDYEEHQGWWYRSVSKTFTESNWASDNSNSADFGIDFITKTDYVTAQYGVFNGEGYHTIGYTDNAGLSYEWRLTAAMMGNGKVHRKQTKTSYWDASFFGQYNTLNSGNDMNGTNKTYSFYGLSTVYNMPSFLLQATYISANNDNDYSYHHNGEGFSVNGEFRMGSDKQYRIFARYDDWKAKAPSGLPGAKDSTDTYAIYGVAWQQNSNVTWLLNGRSYNTNEHIAANGSAQPNWNDVMATAEVSW